MIPNGPGTQPCVFAVASSLTNGIATIAEGTSLSNFLTQPPFNNAVTLRHDYRAVFISPGLTSSDYDILAALVQPGGILDEFVQIGGALVVDPVGIPSNNPTLIAPGGVMYDASAASDFEFIPVQSRPYFTGFGFAGHFLTSSDFSAWGPTNDGILSGYPSGSTVLLQDTSSQATLVEYPWGTGKVLATSLNFCAQGETGPDRPALENLLRYGVFFMGSAQTPAATFTSTPTPTFTPTPPTATPTTPRPTATITQTPTASATPSATSSILPGDVDGNGCLDGRDLQLLVSFLFNPDGAPPEADANGDGGLSAADLAALQQQLAAGPRCEGG